MTSASDELELAAEQLEHLAGHLGVDLEPHDATELAAPAQHRLDRLEEVLGFVLELEVGVAGDAERVVREHLHAGEQGVELRRDDLLEQHEALAVGQRDEAGEQRRHLHPREALVAARRVAHGDREVQRQVGDVGERVRGVDRQRREHREDRVDEQLLEVGPVVGGEVVPVGEADAGVLERGHDLVGEHRRRPVDQLVDPAPDRAELVDEVEAVGGGGAQAGVELLHEARDPHLEELVEVLAEDGEELGPLEQRQAVVLGQGEDAGVEVEPRELAVQEALGSVGERRMPVRGVRGSGVQPGHRRNATPGSAFRTGPIAGPGSRARVTGIVPEGHEH